jgi:hypothetical protein
MKKARLGWIAGLGIALALCMTSLQAQAAEVISLSPGDSSLREFVLYDQFDFLKLGPAEVFAIIGTGDNSTNKIGDMTISVKATATKTFGSVVDFTLMGLAYPIAGKPAMISQTSTAGIALTKTLKTSGQYGIAIVVIYIKTLEGDVNLPVQFSITASLAAYVKK